ncbi:hypothetical protein ABPG75_005473 [Micractinium tetrahymenae]
MIPASSASSFEHVTLEDAAMQADADKVAAEMEEVTLEDGAGAAAAAAPAERAQGAGQAAGSSTGGGASAGAAPAAHAAAGQPQPRSPPPATQALASVLGFFGTDGSSSGSGGQAEEPQPQPGEGGAVAPAAAAGGKSGQQQGELDAVEAFEREALEAADKVAHAAEEVGQKLLHGAAEAKESLASLVGGISSWWANLDPTKPAGPSSGDATAGGGGGAVRRAASPTDVAAAAEALGLEAGETVLESFGCVLWQTYTSTNNFFTPVRQVSFPGSLHVTSRRLCFAFEDKGVAPIKLPGKAIKGVAKAAADAAQGLPERLELALEGAGQSLVVGGFALGPLELDSALALVEHLAEDCSA